jgi:RecB family exonuclease
LKVRHLSASSIKTFKTCQYSYYLSYVRGLRGFNNAGALKGTITHDTVEEILLNKFEKNIDTRASLSDILLLNFDRVLKEDNDDCISEEDIDECLGYASKILFDKEHDYFNKKILGVEKKFDLCMSEFGIVLYDNISGLFDGEENAKELEYNFIKDMRDFAFRIFGFIDLIIELDKDTIEIVDWKTSKKCLTPIEARKDVQLLIYDLVCRILFPEYKNRMVTLYYCKHKPITECFSNNDASNTIKALAIKWKQINMCALPQKTISKADSFWKCAYCAFYSDASDSFADRSARCKANCDIYYNLQRTEYDMDVIDQCVKDKVDLREIYG